MRSQSHSAYPWLCSALTATSLYWSPHRPFIVDFVTILGYMKVGLVAHLRLEGFHFIAYCSMSMRLLLLQLELAYLYH